MKIKLTENRVIMLDISKKIWQEKIMNRDIVFCFGVYSCRKGDIREYIYRLFGLEMDEMGIGIIRGHTKQDILLYIDGFQLSEDDFKKKIRMMCLKYMDRDMEKRYRKYRGY